MGGLAAALSARVVLLLRVPMLGSWANYVLIMVALLFTSLGLGFNISLSAKSDSQAIQSAMILLLASIFFSGFFLALYRLWTPIHVLSWALPATYGIALLQDVMLRSQQPELLLLAGLFAFGTALFLLAWFRLRRRMARD